ncbi:MAG: prephenate dehydrogenase [Clostridia bacterium]|nr:prephenate dehydrogenase [Clostridia bacterium]
MTVGVVGLGLIGGSLAKALKAKTQHTVLGCDTNEATVRYAELIGCIDGRLTAETLSQCEFVLLAVYPGATVDYVRDHAAEFAAGTIVIDCGGVKRSICEMCRPLAAEHGFVFIGGHPMAGLHRSGLKYATDTLYDGASMILTPKDTRDISLLEKVTAFVKSMGFETVTVTTPEQHDEIIAFTSQLAHVVSNAYVKSPRAQVHRGFSAGSYKDLTRVARLNDAMWAELFLENRDNLLNEIDILMASLGAYRDALEDRDEDTLRSLLRAGSERKERIDFDHEHH